MAVASCVPVPVLVPVAKVAPPVAAPPVAADFVFQGRATQGGVMIGRAPEGTSTLTLDGEAIAIADDRTFLIAFDRDSPETARLIARDARGTETARTITVAPRAWDIQSLPTLPKMPVPSADYQRRRPEEVRQIAAARAIATDAEGWRQRFAGPATGRISGRFGSQRIYAGEPGAYHSGVDVALPTGAPVAAPADGVVILAAETSFTLEGGLLMIDHGMGLNSAFLHLSRIDVRAGDRVTRGQVIGAVGQTGRATGPHLHWGMKWRDRRIDPLLQAGPMPGR